MAKGQGYFEKVDPVTGKARKHQENALKAFGKSVSNAEVKPQSDDCAEKVKVEIDDWEPNSETVEDLIALLNKLENCSDYDKNDPFELESQLSVADDYQEFADDYSDYPVWTVDHEGTALTGEDAGTTIPAIEIDPEYFAMHGFTAEEVSEIQEAADAKMEDDEPYDEMRGKIYHFDDSSKWIIFETQEAAESQAVNYVESMLEDEPETFAQSWLESFIYMTDTDRRSIADEEATDYAYEQLDENEAVKEAGFDDKFDKLQEDIDLLESEIEDLEEEKSELESSENEYPRGTHLNVQISDIEDKISGKMDEIHLLGKKQEALPDEAREKVQEDKYDEIYDELDDPVQYFVEDHGTYTMETLMEASFVSIDEREAAKDAIETDGIAHFLAGHDGNEVEVGDTSIVMYRVD